MRICYTFEVRLSVSRLLLASLSSFPLGSLIDYIAVSGSMERNVLEFVDHLHEHFLNPCSINKQGRYNVPDKTDEGYRYVWSMICAKVSDDVQGS